MNKATVGRQDASAEIRGRDLHRFYTTVLLLVFCTLFYYFGELIDFFGWAALHWDFFYGVHDIHRLLFLAPIIYAGYFFGVRPAIIVMIIAVSAFLPRALFISPFPDPLSRTLLFIVIAGVIAYLTGRQSERCKRLEVLMRRQNDAILGILERMEEGVLITSPDYKIRFLNPSMARSFGEGIGTHCYRYLHNLDGPCQQTCRLPSVAKGTVERLEYDFPDGKTYEVLASPYVDSDGTVCQLAVFRDITRSAKD